MVRVLFFGKVREDLGCSSLEIALDAAASLEGLQRYLCDQRGGKWPAVLGQDNIIRAVNHSVVDGDVELAEGDEVAFFPPVTGG